MGSRGVVVPPPSMPAGWSSAFTWFWFCWVCILEERGKKRAPALVWGILAGGWVMIKQGGDKGRGHWVYGKGGLRGLPKCVYASKRERKQGRTRSHRHIAPLCTCYSFMLFGFGVINKSLLSRIWFGPSNPTHIESPPSPSKSGALRTHVDLNPVRKGVIQRPRRPFPHLRVFAIHGHLVVREQAGVQPRVQDALSRMCFRFFGGVGLNWVGRVGLLSSCFRLFVRT